MNANSAKESASFLVSDKEINTCSIIDAAASELPTVCGPSETDSEHQIREEVKSTLAESETIRDINSSTKDSQGRIIDIRTCMNNIEKGNFLNASTDDVKHVQPMLNIRKESPCSVPLSKPGDISFSSSLLGPDGTYQYLGKWCKRSQSKGSVTPQGTNASSGDLIAVGSDGRGGRVKVLRSLNQSTSQNSKENSTAAKRCKYGIKPNNLQSQGCLQMEHFLRRATD